MRARVSISEPEWARVSQRDLGSQVPCSQIIMHNNEREICSKNSTLRGRLAHKRSHFCKEVNWATPERMHFFLRRTSLIYSTFFAKISFILSCSAASAFYGDVFATFAPSIFGTQVSGPIWCIPHWAPMPIAHWVINWFQKHVLKRFFGGLMVPTRWVVWATLVNLRNLAARKAHKWEREETMTAFRERILAHL